MKKNNVIDLNSNIFFLKKRLNELENLLDFSGNDYIFPSDLELYNEIRMIKEKINSFVVAET